MKKEKELRNLTEVQCLFFKASDTGILSDKDIEEQKSILGDIRLFNQEYECDFGATLHGSIYSEILKRLKEKGNIRSIPIDNNLPVDFFLDLGLDSNFACWVLQRQRDMAVMVDYITNMESLDVFCDYILKNYFKIGRVVLPHDGTRRSMNDSVTPEGLIRNRLSVAKSGGSVMVVKRGRTEEGVYITKSKITNLYFNEPKCLEGLSSLKSYRYRWDDNIKSFTTMPVKDWTSHGADALRTWAMSQIDKVNVFNEMIRKERAEGKDKYKVFNGYLNEGSPKEDIFASRGLVDKTRMF